VQLFFAGTVGRLLAAEENGEYLSASNKLCALALYTSIQTVFFFPYSCFF
jgi:hypothetical protein